MVNEETGFVFHYCDGVAAAYPDLYVNNPDAEVWFGYAFEGDDGVLRAMATSGFNGVIAFSKTANPTEDDLKECLAFYNALATPEGALLFDWGVEGHTYHIEDGYGVRSDEENTQYNATIVHYGQTNPFGVSNASKLEAAGLTELHIAARDEKFEYYDVAVGDLRTGLESDTWKELETTELIPIMSDAVNLYIQGKIDDDAYWAAVQDWLDAGGQDAIDEFYAAYQAR